MCGYAMPKGSIVYRAFSQGDGAVIRRQERERASDPSGPLHRSCILYSAMVCPHLREKTARIAKDSDINPGGRRGTRAAVMGFQDFGLLIAAKQHRLLDPAVPDPNFIYLALVDDIPYQDGEELLGRYEEAVAADSTIIDTTQSRHYWTDNADDERQLARALKTDAKTFNREEPDFEQSIRGQGDYFAYVR
ncbi:hypothetical protein AXA44_30875 [Rhodococcus sp. SC4]|nr:hypothetical protein AXA44_30875 [Rhodococcus sp. SC4]